MIFTFTFDGQLPSGKNSIIITRTGKRFPSKRFSDWKKLAIPKLKLEMQDYGLDNFPILKPCSVFIDYIPSDRRRRDVPGVIDAIWHVLEKCGIVSDDVLLGGPDQVVTFQNMGLIKNVSGATVEIKT